ncbi:hypothetical protein BGW36DRAFT_463607 [Talaromyces proteolyticus]|uniref:Fucose-specific lectin n=1 Tax=Talaromyces proteolyticus TaxID=1131652 RepID=A0AAD4KMX9_9EURO|nr:uncharacterized protein BGW36DRAFT_463607 [Talaromyces proteolyticus]KAH8693995.1 hypothetical protein BGW36DRAFT_463607 [Talaromyces proteolyticus]
MGPPTNQITVIPNPAVKDTRGNIPGIPDSVKKTSHIHLKFGVTGSRQLSLQVYDTTNITNPTEYADNGASVGFIHEPGTLAGAIQNNIPVIYGIASSGTSDNKDTGVCKLSPYYNPILKSNPTSEKDAGVVTTNLWSLTACDDGGQKNWVYFLRNVGDDTNPKIVLVQLDVDPLDRADETILELNYSAGAGSRLASFFDESPYVFYVHDAEDELGIYYVNATTPKSANRINDTSTVKTKSPLAIVTNASTNDRNDITLQLTLYFVNNNGYLSYVLGTLDNGYITWDQTHQSLQNIRVDQTSSLAVISGADNKTHYIYVVPREGQAGGYVVKTATPWQRRVAPPS